MLDNAYDFMPMSDEEPARAAPADAAIADAVADVAPAAAVATEAPPAVGQLGAELQLEATPGSEALLPSTEPAGDAAAGTAEAASEADAPAVAEQPPALSYVDTEIVSQASVLAAVPYTQVVDLEAAAMPATEPAVQGSAKASAATGDAAAFEDRQPADTAAPAAAQAALPPAGAPGVAAATAWQQQQPETIYLSSGSDSPRSESLPPPTGSPIGDATGPETEEGFAPALANQASGQTLGRTSTEVRSRTKYVDHSFAAVCCLAPMHMNRK